MCEPAIDNGPGSSRILAHQPKSANVFLPISQGGMLQARGGAGIRKAQAPTSQIQKIPCGEVAGFARCLIGLSRPSPSVQQSGVLDEPAGIPEAVCEKPSAVRPHCLNEFG